MTQLTHGECAPVTRRRTCPSPTRRELWRLVRIILRNRRVHSHRPDNGRRRRLHARKQMRMVGADARSMQSPRTMHRRQSRPDDAELRLDARECSREHRALPPPRSKQRVCGCHRTTKKRVHSRTSQVRERPAPRWIASKLGRREREDRSREVRSGAACATWDSKFPCRRPRPYRSNSIRIAIRAPGTQTNASCAW